MMRGIFTFFWLSFLASHTCLAQFSDNFSDGNFTANPVWVGDTDKFLVESEILRLNDIVAGQSYLATQSTLAIEVQWDFWVRIAFSPSNSNHPRIYLMSDQQNLRGPLNGYFLQIGRDGTDNKRIFLMRQNGTITTTLLTGSQNLATASNNIMRIRVTRTSEGRFDVWADASGGNLFLPQGTATDLTFTNTNWFGVVCVYTVTNIRNFFFDDFAVGPIVHDTTPPSVNLVEVVSANQINVHFSEVVDLATAQTSSNYVVSHSIGSPLTASRNLSRPNIVNLFFSTPLAENFNYELSVSNVMDQANNVMNPFAVIFAHYVPSPFDIVFNEIMANPSPAVALPPHEYIELYNNSEFAINLNGWILQHGTTSRVLPMVNIPPKSYLILTHEAAVPSLMPFGAVVGVPGLSTTALTNAGTSLFLFAPSGRLISFVTYSDRWYRNPAKSNGGWSLEKIDPLNYCQGPENWRASDHPSGGTPAVANSILRSNPDITPPDLRRIGYVNPTTLRLFFSEPMDAAGIATLVGAGDIGIGNVASAQALLPDFSVAEITLSTPIEPGRIFEITLPSHLSDCAGNLLNNRKARVAVPQTAEPFDVVINEVLFNPPAHGSRYIELFNRSQKVIDLRDHIISSKDTIMGFLTTIRDISTESYLFFPGDYLVLTSDPDAVRATFMTTAPHAFQMIPTMPSMTNTSGVLVFASRGMVEIDLFAYNENMHFALLRNLKGVALERINPNWPTRDRSNWHSASQSFGFGTPGFRNSQYLPERPVQAGSIEVYPEVFSPDGDGFNDLLSVNYRFDQPGYVATVRIFDSRGRLMRNLVRAELLAVNGSFTWDGTTDERLKAPIGVYILHIEITDLAGNVKQFRKTAVLGGRL